MELTTSTQPSRKENLLSGFRPASQNGFGTTSAARLQAIAALDSLDLPTRKTESWKYTDLRTLSSRTYQQSVATFKGEIAPFLIPGLDAHLLVFVNGCFDQKLSASALADAGIQVQPVSTLKGADYEAFEALLGTAAKPNADIFTAINNAYAREGVFIRVAANHEQERPIYLLHLNDANQTTAFQQRNIIQLEAGASVKLIEAFHSLDQAYTLRNEVTEIHVGNGANLEFVKIQSESDQATIIDSTEIHQAAHSKTNVFTYTFSGEIVRNNVYVRLNEEHCEAHLFAAYMLNGTQIQDHHTEMHHIAPNCFSNELYKGIVDDESTGVFNGQIHVYPDAQKTNAFQSSRGILLSESGNIFTKPQLEIYADDVKCSHGAATGHLDEDAMFYLRARGIREKDARLMLMHAFALETAETLSLDAVKAYIGHRVDTRY